MTLNHYPQVTEPDPNLYLWRYMPFPDFHYWVEHRCLPFKQKSVLARSDPREGGLGSISIMKAVHQHRRLLEQYTANDQNPGEVPNQDDILDRIFNCIKSDETDFEKEVNQYYISCWHAAAHESLAMWQLYCPDHTGVAVRIRAGSLLHYLESHDHSVTASMVKYGDLGGFMGFVHKLPTDSLARYRLFTKATHFQHEKEFRILIHSSDITMNTTGLLSYDFPFDLTDIALSDKPAADINLPLSIYVKPGTGDWFRRHLAKWLSTKGFSGYVMKSQIDMQDPTMTEVATAIDRSLRTDPDKSSSP